MTAHARLQSSYSRPDIKLRPMRNIEYEALAKVSQQLSAAWRKKDEDFPTLVAALNENRRLWRIFAADVSSEGNGLPQSLRAGLFYLYEFVHEHTRGVLRDALPIKPLIDINTSVMRGLRGEGRIK